MLARFPIIFAVSVFALGSFGITRAHQLHTHPAGPNGETHSHELGVAITCASPPYYYLNGDDGGLEWSLLSMAFDTIGHPARALYLPLSDALKDFRRGWLDAVWVCGSEQPGPEGSLYWSESLIPRRIAAITLAESDILISSVSDLSGKTVGIHPEVAEVLGDTELQLQETEPPLHSISNHALLLLKLFTRRIDVLVAETSTFDYFRKKLPGTVDPGQEVAVHEIFPPIYPRLVFRDAKLRDEFNTAWTAVDKNITYESNVSPSTSANITEGSK